MLRHISTAAFASVFLLSGCGARSYEETAAPKMEPAAPIAVEAAADAEYARQSGGEGGSPAAAPGVTQYMAYVHSVGLRLPVATIEPTQAGHIKACKDAGTAVCIVINSQLQTYSEDQKNASLQMKAKPDWIDAFLAGIDAETKAARGEIAYRNTTAEDLTVQIIDTEATLRAKTALQARLEKLLADRPGKLGELLETETALANVNGEIDSLKSTLAALRLRVDMSDLTMNYETKVNPVSSGALAPLADAGSNFFYNLAGAIGSVITAFAVGLPWLLLIGLFLWIWLKFIWPRIRRNKPAA
jgi:hypothetical protein